MLMTCKQYATPTVRGNGILTTRTDYVDKYASTLQTTSYNFTGTQSTTEICAGVVKAPATIHPKNPCQHATDLVMLEQQVELLPAFQHPETGTPKYLNCIQVDSVSEEVQYYWIERHLFKNKVATLITTRSSGSSYLNRVELQNGCLSLGHSGTFIPSTLAGSCMDPNTGVWTIQSYRKTWVLPSMLVSIGWMGVHVGILWFIYTMVQIPLSNRRYVRSCWSSERAKL